MILFVLAFFFLFLSFDEIWLSFRGSIFELGRRNPIRELTQVVDELHRFQEILESGSAPSSDEWVRFAALPAPWGKLCSESFSLLRETGAEVLPTLRRLRELADFQKETLQRARAKGAQALGQAGLVLFLVPVFGSVLFLLMPGLEEHPYFWMGAVTLASVLGLLGAIWLMRMVDQARWAGLPSSRQEWMIVSLLAGERFLALLRTGRPSDLAWAQAAEMLMGVSPELRLLWGDSFWDTRTCQKVRSAAESKIFDLGVGIRKSVQAALLEGFSCSERVEALLLSTRQSFESLVEHQLALLPNRSLKPLYFCVAPSVFFLLGTALWLSWSSVTMI